MEGSDGEKSDVYLLVGKQVSAVAGRLPLLVLSVSTCSPLSKRHRTVDCRKGPGTDRKNTIDYSSAQFIPHFVTPLEPLGHH